MKKIHGEKVLFVTNFEIFYKIFYPRPLGIEPCITRWREDPICQLAQEILHHPAATKQKSYAYILKHAHYLENQKFQQCGASLGPDNWALGTIDPIIIGMVK